MRNNPEDNLHSKIYVLLSLGANIGKKRKNVENAINHLSNGNILSEVKISSMYSTEPVGYKDQPEFINAAISGFTTLSLNSLMEACKSLEYLMGRKSKLRWREREIDIDILLYGDQLIKSSKITIPHPRMHERLFVLIPAAEIAGETIHPGLNCSIDKLLQQCSDCSEVEICR